MIIAPFYRAVSLLMRKAKAKVSFELVNERTEDESQGKSAIHLGGAKTAATEQHSEQEKEYYGKHFAA